MKKVEGKRLWKKASYYDQFFKVISIHEKKRFQSLVENQS
jgi:hypothetical protein